MQAELWHSPVKSSDTRYLFVQRLNRKFLDFRKNDEGDVIEFIKNLALYEPHIRRLVQERDNLIQERATLKQERDTLKIEYLRSEAERKALMVEREWLKSGIDVNQHNPGQLGMQSLHPLVQLLGYKMIVNPEDIGISKELFDWRVHEPYCTLIYGSLIKPGDVVFDLGSNIGYYALLSAKKCKQVIAVEPIRENYELLLANIKLNHLSNFLCQQSAISTFNGMQKIYLSVSSNNHSMYPTYSQNYRIVPVKTADTVLQEFRIDKIDYLRMDIEGYEVELLDSMPKAFGSRPKLFIELHIDVVGEDKARKYLLKLKDWGYALQFIVDRDKDNLHYEGNDAVKQMTIDGLLSELHNYRVCSVFLGPEVG
jgi:FkbM family methyltransferase